MRKWLIFVLLGIMFTGCTFEKVGPDTDTSDDSEQDTAVEEPTFEPRTVTATYINIEAIRLNVRSDADIDSSAVGAVYEDEKYQILSEKKDSQKRIWYEVELDDGTTGYVAAWYCTKTEVTILVNEDSTEITDIKAYAMPTYLDNPFDPEDVEVGDQIVGLTVNEITQISDLNKIVFEGQVELSGEFYNESSDLAYGTVIRFVPDEASSVLLPRLEEDVSSAQFILNDYDTISSQFGDVGTHGYATITIENYTIGYGTSDAYNSADLVSATIE